MDENVLVSVVVPAYNSENFIAECLESLISQTFSNLEIIVVDDGSTDRTLEICRAYTYRDDRIKVLTHKNCGVSASRNEGILGCTGDYIIFIDADDYVEKDIVESYLDAYRLWEGKDVAFINCGMYIDNDVNKRVGSRVSVLETAHGYLEGEDYLLGRSSSATLAWLKLFNYVTNKCYRMDIIKENNICFDKNIHVAEDLKFNLDYLSACTGYIGMANKPLYHHVKRTENSLSIAYHADDMDHTKAVYDYFITWISSERGASEDNIMVVKSLYVNDWINRLTAMYACKCKDSDSTEIKKKLKKEIMSSKFRKMTREVYRAGKMSKIKYYSLKTGTFGVFWFFRSIYQLSKG